MKIIGGHKGVVIKESIDRSSLPAIELFDSILIITPDSNEFTDVFFNQVIERNKLELFELIFIWNDLSSINNDDKFVFKFLSENVFYIKCDSHIKFIDDVILVLKNKIDEKKNLEKKDVCIIYNINNKVEAKKITSLLSEIVSTVSIEYSSSIDLYQEVSFWVDNVKNIVLLGFENEDWAHSLIPELWKILGGNSSLVKLFCVFNLEPTEKLGLAGVDYIISEDELMPIEIKMSLNIE